MGSWRLLLEAGSDVRCLVLPQDPAPGLDGLDVECIAGDITDAGAVARAARGCDIVSAMFGKHAWALVGRPNRGVGLLQRLP